MGALPPQSNSLNGSPSPHWAGRCLKILLRQTVAQEVTMQRGSLALVSRKEGPDVWQFRWSEKDLHGARIQRKRVIGTVERYPDGAAARTAMTIVLAELNSGKARISCGSITVAQLCDHFEQRELTRDNTWRSYSTKKTYQAYLNRWVLPHWRHYELAEVRTIQVESWLRRLPLAKSKLRQNPKSDVRSFQPRLPIRTVRPQSNLPRSSECKAPQSANRPDAR